METFWMYGNTETFGLQKEEKDSKRRDVDDDNKKDTKFTEDASGEQTDAVVGGVVVTPVWRNQIIENKKKKS